MSIEGARPATPPPTDPKPASSTALSVVDKVAQRFNETSRQLCALTDAQKSVSALTIIRQGMFELRNDKKLQACTPDSVYQSIAEAIRCGLEIGGHLGYAFLIPYKNECQLQISSQGEIELVRRSGCLYSIRAIAIRAKDQFDTACDPPKHTFDIFSGDRGEIVAFYAVAKLADGMNNWELMTRAEVEKIRDGSVGYKAAIQFKKDSPWISAFEEMGKKTVLKRLAKWLPKSITPKTEELPVEKERDIVDVDYQLS